MILIRSCEGSQHPALEMYNIIATIIDMTIHHANIYGGKTRYPTKNDIFISTLFILYPVPSREIRTFRVFA